MALKSLNIYSMALYRKSLLAPGLKMLFCNYVVLFLPEIGINNSLGHLAVLAFGWSSTVTSVVFPRPQDRE